MRSLDVPNLAAGMIDTQPQRLPIDNARRQLAQAQTGVGRSFVYAAPQAGIAIFSPFKARQVTDPKKRDLLPGSTSALPVSPQ